MMPRQSTSGYNAATHGSAAMISTREIVPSDFGPVLRIEQAVYETPWDAPRFRRCFTAGVSGIVAVAAGRIVGYAVYALHPDYLRVINLTVDPACRRRGVGTALVNRIAVDWPGVEVVVHVPDTMLNAHLFLRSAGFLASVLREHDLDCDGDVYAFVYAPGCATIENRR